MKISARLFVDQPLAEGQNLVLAENQDQYIRHVLRLQKGDRVAVFNGKEGEWQAIIENVGKSSIELVLLQQTRLQKEESGPWLLFSPLKKNRTDFVIEKATELGVSQIQPVFTRYTNAERVNEERLQTIAQEAAEQSERLTVPKILSPASLESILSTWEDNRHLLVAAERQSVPDVVTVLQDIQPQQVAFLVGPEGGFAAEEINILGTYSFVKFVNLGPRILRADTAAMAVLTCWQAWCGDWKYK